MKYVTRNLIQTSQRLKAATHFEKRSESVHEIPMWYPRHHHPLGRDDPATSPAAIMRLRALPLTLLPLTAHRNALRALVLDVELAIVVVLEVLHDVGLELVLNEPAQHTEVLAPTDFSVWTLIC